MEATPTNGDEESSQDPDRESELILTTEAVPSFRQTPSLRPALIVVGIAVGVIVLFGTLAAIFGTNHTPTPTVIHPKETAPAAAVTIPGTDLTSVPATQALAPVLHPGSPPRNVLRGLTIPNGAKAFSHTSTTGTGGTGQFDATVNFSIDTSQETLITFYRHTLNMHGWKTFSIGSAHKLKNGIEVLSQKAGTDGWYWEAGAVISPTRFKSANNGAGSGASTTRFSLRLFQVPDPF